MNRNSWGCSWLELIMIDHQLLAQWSFEQLVLRCSTQCHIRFYLTRLSVFNVTIKCMHGMMCFLPLQSKICSRAHVQPWCVYWKHYHLCIDAAIESPYKSVDIPLYLSDGVRRRFLSASAQALPWKFSDTANYNNIILLIIGASLSGTNYIL